MAPPPNTTTVNKTIDSVVASMMRCVFASPKSICSASANATAPRKPNNKTKRFKKNAKNIFSHTAKPHNKLILARNFIFSKSVDQK